MVSNLPNRSAWFAVVIVLIAAASCFHVFVCFAHNPMDYIWSDMRRHWDNGLSFPRGGYTGAADPIGYQGYIFVLQKLTFGNRYLVAFVCSLLSVLMPWTYYRAARSCGLQKLPALWTWALIAWTPSLLVLYHFIMPETLLLFLDGLALWMTARYVRRGGSGPFLGCIFCWTLACLTKPTVVPLAGVSVLWACWRKLPSWRQLASGLTLALIMLVPQSVRSKFELGFVAPFGNTWLTRIQLRCGTKMIRFNFYNHSPGYLGVHPHFDRYIGEYGSPSGFIRPLEPLSQWAMRRYWRSEEARIVVDSAYGERDWKTAYGHFTPDKNEWLAQWRENVTLFFFAPSWPESVVQQWDGNLEYATRWIWAPLVMVVLVLNVREFLRGRFELIPIATTVLTLVLALQNVIISEGRYRKPVEPLLLLNLVWVLGKKVPRVEDAIRARAALRAQAEV